MSSYLRHPVNILFGFRVWLIISGRGTGGIREMSPDHTGQDWWVDQENIVELYWPLWISL